MNLDFRVMFPISFYRYKNNKDFNPLLFLLDCLIYVIPLSILLTNILIRFI